jgi:5-methyltetrahydropteroyltriglutamate--homocysteine methyltransferase
VVLEIARRPEAELTMLREVKASLGLGIGVIDIKDNEVETPEEVARRIDRAARELGPERIHYVHPDCGFWMLPRSVADAKMHALVAGRDLFAGQ